MEESTYYAIIPSRVRYDKELSANEKLLYGEITALASKGGLCWATNKYFSELYGVESRTIRRWIEHLVERGYVYRAVEYDEDEKTVLRRCLSIVPEGEMRQMSWADKNVHTLRTKMSALPGQKCPPPSLINNTSINNTLQEKEIHKEKECSTTSVVERVYGTGQETAAEKTVRQETITLIAEKSNLTENAAKKTKIEEYFEKIYELYPRKVSKIRGKKTFETKFKGLTEEEARARANQIYLTVKAQTQRWAEENDGEGRRFDKIPYFSTWLNDNVENDVKAVRRGKG